jgi:hypothetical protein
MIAGWCVTPFNTTVSNIVVSYYKCNCKIFRRIFRSSHKINYCCMLNYVMTCRFVCILVGRLLTSVHRCLCIVSRVDLWIVMELGIWEFLLKFVDTLHS